MPFALELMHLVHEMTSHRVYKQWANCILVANRAPRTFLPVMAEKQNRKP